MNYKKYLLSMLLVLSTPAKASKLDAAVTVVSAAMLIGGVGLLVVNRNKKAAAFHLMPLLLAEIATYFAMAGVGAFGLYCERQYLYKIVSK
jgi:uncharacterized membrane protein